MYLSAKDALEYGIIDKVLFHTQGNGKVSNLKSSDTQPMVSGKDSGKADKKVSKGGKNG